VLEDFGPYLWLDVELQAGEGCLARRRAPASLRQLLADQLDDLRRALAVRSGAGKTIA
jgi:hypothetical protein